MRKECLPIWEAFTDPDSWREYDKEKDKFIDFAIKKGWDDQKAEAFYCGWLAREQKDLWDLHVDYMREYTNIMTDMREECESIKHKTLKRIKNLPNWMA